MNRPRRPGAVSISAPSFPTMPRPPLYRRIAVTFIGLVVVVGLAVLWLTSVRAEVKVKVRQEAVVLDGTVDIAGAPKPGELPGKVAVETITRTQEFQVKESGEVATTTPSVPEPVTPPPAPMGPVRARGTVRVVNTSSHTQPLVRTTRLLTADGKLYRLDRGITVKPGEEVSVEVYADKTGEEYAIGPSKFTIPGLFIDLQKYIYAQSDKAFKAIPEGKEASEASEASAPSSPFQPPSSPTGRIVTQADLDEAERTLNDAIVNQAKKALAPRLPEDPSYQVVYLVRKVDQGNNAKIGQAADSFLASLTLEVTAVAFPKEDMQALLRGRLKEKVPTGREIIPFADDAVTYEKEKVDTDAQTATLRVHVDASYRLSSQSPLLQKTLVAGKTKDEAVELLKSVEGVEDATVEIKPNWFTHIPSLKDRITMTVE